MLRLLSTRPLSCAIDCQTAGDVHVLEVDVLGARQADAVAGGVLDGAAGAVGGAGAGDVQIAAGAGVVEHDAVGAAVGGGSGSHVVGADRRVDDFSAVPVVDVIVLPLPSTLTVAAGGRGGAGAGGVEAVAGGRIDDQPAVRERDRRTGIVRQVDGRRCRAGDRLARARERDRAGSVVVEQDAGIGGDIVGDVAGQRDVAGARGAVLDVYRLAGAVGLGDRARIGDRGRAAGVGAAGAVADPECIAVGARDAATAERDRAAGHAVDGDGGTRAVGRRWSRT